MGGRDDRLVKWIFLASRHAEAYNENLSISYWHIVIVRAIVGIELVARAARTGHPGSAEGAVRDPESMRVGLDAVARRPETLTVSVLDPGLRALARPRDDVNCYSAAS